MTQIRTIENAAKEIKALDPNTAINAYRIRQMVNENLIPYTPVGNRKLINMEDVWYYFKNPTPVSNNTN